MNWTRINGAVVVALLSTAVHGQICSGGPGGGADATGNDCGLDTETQRVFVSSDKMTGAHTPVAPSAAPMRSSKMAPVVITLPRLSKLRLVSTALVEPAKIVPRVDAEGCSRGANGGMDATGNDC